MDNQEVLDLIAVRPLNIFALVDEESKFPQGSDATLLSKLNQNHSKNVFYCQAKSDNVKNFAVVHFAGIVAYNVTGNFRLTPFDNSLFFILGQDNFVMLWNFIFLMYIYIIFFLYISYYRSVFFYIRILGEESRYVQHRPVASRSAIFHEVSDKSVQG